MEFETDREIDLLLRKVAQPETVVSERFGAHIDADEISLFAETALTNKARTRIVNHLADCAKCRKILSNVIVLNAEDSSEIVHTKETQSEIKENAIPWYRKLFAFPNLAYTMGGLTVLLGGMIAFIAFQGINETANAPSIAQMEKTTIERSRGAGGADSDGESVTVETYSAPSANSAANSALAVSNAATATANAASVANNAPKSSANAVAETAGSGANRKDVENKKAAEQQAEESAKTAQSAPTENQISTDSIVALPSQENYSISRNQSTITPDSRNVQRQSNELPMSARRNQSITTQSLPQAAAPPKVEDAGRPRSADDSRKSEIEKAIGGKKFVRRDGAWYDSSYNQQKPTNIRRNSEDYKKLDSGLRSIADNLGGVVVVVWKGKAYRIE